MIDKRLRNLLISVFVIVWIVLFHYESTRFFYLNPRVGRELPKTPLLFPPAGWIMFFNVDDTYGCAEVYGIKNGVPQLIDAHDILRVRTIGYDNIHRNALSTVLSQGMRPAFCRFLSRKFPYFDQFAVVAVYWPSVTKEPYKKISSVAYQCP